MKCESFCFPTALVALVAALFGLGAPPSFAVDEGPAATRFFVSAGDYLSDFDTRIAIGSGSILGTLFAAEALLGLDEHADVFRLDGFYRITARQKIGFGFFDVNRTGLWIHIHQHRFGAHDRHRGGGRHKGHGRHDHFIARPHAKRSQNQLQRRGAIIYPDGPGRAAVSRKFLLKLVHLRS